MLNKLNLVLYVNAELVEEMRECGFNLQKIENHIKTLIKVPDYGYSVKYDGESNIA